MLIRQGTEEGKIKIFATERVPVSIFKSDADIRSGHIDFQMPIDTETSVHYITAFRCQDKHVIYFKIIG